MRAWPVAVVMCLCAVVSNTALDLTDKSSLVLESEEEEFSAIQAIHAQLDNNHDGSVDLIESSEFVETELCGEGGSQDCPSSDKSKRFHQSDKQITSLELWTTWHRNKVINWTTDDVVWWLEGSVGLPEYSEVFRAQGITGHHLPQLASNSSILKSLLLIKNSQHRQKIQLRAMDVVLFGPPSGLGYWKDAIVVLSIVLCVCGLIYALRQRQVAQYRIDSFLDNFQGKEKELRELKLKLELEKVSNEAADGGSSSSDPPPSSEDSGPVEVHFRHYSQDSMGAESQLSQVQEENESLRSQLLVMESQISSYSGKLSQLHTLLQDSCKREWSLLDNRRKHAEEQMASAQKVCYKIKKKRQSLFGTIHLANSSALEEAGLQITKAVNKMHAISDCFDEYHRRWEKIEELCGYSIVPHHTAVPLGYHRGPTRGDSSASLASLATIGNMSKGSPELSRQSGGSVSSMISSAEDSLDMPEARTYTRSQSSGPCEFGAENINSTIINHSFSAPLLKRTSAAESLDSDKLEPIREEKNHNSPTSTVKKRSSLNRKYKSSEV